MLVIYLSGDSYVQEHSYGAEFDHWGKAPHWALPMLLQVAFGLAL